MDWTGTEPHSPGNDSAPHLGMASSSSRSDITRRRTTGTATPGSHRPGSALVQQPIGSPLPVIKCNHCPRLVLRRVSTTPKHPGWVFFKCEKDGEPERQVSPSACAGHGIRLEHIGQEGKSAIFGAPHPCSSTKFIPATKNLH